jgi:hypothetical protein
MKTDKINPERTLTLAIIDALKMWSDTRYERFLDSKTPGTLDQAWFKWFIGEWSVARTIRKDDCELVRKYLNVYLRRAMNRKQGAAAIDHSAQHIQKNEWSSHKRKDGTSSVPLSIVSKVGFFFCPSEIIPYDSLARMGLNKIRGTIKKGGEGHLQCKLYVEHLDAFNHKFEGSHESIIKELKKDWVTSLSRRLGCFSNCLDKIEFHRKVFDNQLLHIGIDSRNN